MRVISQPSEGGDPSSIPSFPGNADTSTQTPPPADGGIIWNNATQASATEIYVSATDADGNDVKQSLLEYPKSKDVLNIRTTASTDTYQQWEIVNITDQGTYVEYDVILIEENGGNIADAEPIIVGFDLKFDENAIHKNIANEIQNLTNKASAASGDVLLLEDSADSFNKKKIAVSSLLPAASETVSGILELATQAETDAGLDDLRAVTPLKLATYVAANALTNPLTADLITAGFQIKNTAVNGSVIFNAGGTGAAGERGYYDFLDSFNPTKGLRIQAASNVYIFDSVDGLASSFSFRSGGSTILNYFGTGVQYSVNVQPNVDGSLNNGSSVTNWGWVRSRIFETSTGANMRLLASQAGGYLDIRPGSAASRGYVAIRDTQNLSNLLKITASGSITFDTEGASGQMIFKVQGNAGVLSIQPAQVVFSAPFIPDGQKTRNIGGSSRAINILYASRIIDPSASLTLESSINGGNVILEPGTAAQRGHAIVNDQQTTNNRDNLLISSAIDNTTDQSGVAQYTANKPASDFISASSTGQTTIYSAPTGHKISPNWVKIKALSGTFTSDVTVSVGTTGDLTKYLNQVAIFGATPSIGEVVKLNINNPDDVDDLIITVDTAATGTSPALRAWNDSELMEDE